MTDDLVERVASVIRWKSMTSEEIARAAIAIALKEAAKVAESIKSYDDLVNKSAGCYTTGQSIAHAILGMIKN